MPPTVKIKGKPKKPAPAKASNPAEAFITNQIPTVEDSSKQIPTNQDIVNQDNSKQDVPKPTEKMQDNQSRTSETESDKPRRGRPPKKTETKKQYSISIKPSLYDKAKKKAEERETSVNEIISEALSKYLK